MFDPTIGQFVNDDPIEFDAGDPNLRRFVGNNPTNATDPSGQWEEWVGGQSNNADVAPIPTVSDQPFRKRAAFLAGLTNAGVSSFAASP